jgi:MFS family permease
MRMFFRSHPFRPARVAVATLFFVNGALFAGWVTRVPDVRDRVGAGEAELGLALLGVAVGSLLTMPAAGWACARWGSRWVAVAGGLTGCASIPLPALAQDVPQLAVALGLIGATFGALDVAMNVEAIAVEERYRRPIMPSFHGWFSTGGLTGALAGGVLASAAVGAVPHLAGTAAVAALAVAWSARHLLPAARANEERDAGLSGSSAARADEEPGAGLPGSSPAPADEERDAGLPGSSAARADEEPGAGLPGSSPAPADAAFLPAHPRSSPAPPVDHAASSRPRGPSPLLLVCGLIAFCAAVGEGAMADWSALYLTDSLGASAGLAAMGYAAFAGAMAVGRFAGDRAIRTLGSAGTLQLGCGAAAIALAAGLAAADTAATIAAFAIAGLGVACVFPVVLSAAGRAEPGRSGPAVALVSTIGYTGFLAGPPFIGFVADRTTLAWGLGVVALLAAVAAVLAVRLRAPRASAPRACLATAAVPAPSARHGGE